MKRIIFSICLLALIFTGCNASEGENDKNAKKQEQTKAYVGDSIVVLPDENLYEEDILHVTDLQMNLQGEPALYQLESATNEDGDEYMAIVEHTLNRDGNWQKKEYCEKQILKLLQDEVEHNVDFLHVQRGDDGNLYVLVKRSDEPLGFSGAMGNFEERTFCEYSVLGIDESNNSFVEVKLDTKIMDEEGKEVNYALEHEVTAFHVMEDGTTFLVFDGSAAMWFDGVTGTQTNFCPTIADSAFGKRVAYGEAQILYFSTGSNLFGILDNETLTVSNNFGEEIPENDRKFEWYFDTDTTTWQTYAFNQSGLYRISDFGKKASATLISNKGNFDKLADATIYDVLVGANEELYVLVRCPSDGDDGGFDFGVLRYEPK